MTPPRQPVLDTQTAAAPDIGQGQRLFGEVGTASSERRHAFGLWFADAPLVRQVRAGLRRRAAPLAASAWGQVAPGRGPYQDQRGLQYLWRVVDQDGNVLDIVQTRAGRLRSVARGRSRRAAVHSGDRLTSVGSVHR
jgi:hypothetical protein